MDGSPCRDVICWVIPCNIVCASAEVLEAWKKVENSVTSFAAVGITIDAEAAGEADAACSTAQGLISSLFPAVLATLQSEDEEVASSLNPFLQSYVAKLKAGLKRTGQLSQVRGSLHVMPVDRQPA